MGEKKYPEFPIVKVGKKLSDIAQLVLTRSLKISDFACIVKDDDKPQWKTVLIKVRFKQKKEDEA